MALSSNAILPAKSSFPPPISLKLKQPTFSPLHRQLKSIPCPLVHTILAVYENPSASDESSTSALTSTKPPTAVTTTAAPFTTKPESWSLDSWESRRSSQLPEYPHMDELESVLKTIESFPPTVFAGEARTLEERLAEAEMGKAFLLKGRDCAESFKEFNANNIRDTYRILLQIFVGSIYLLISKFKHVCLSFFD